MNLWVLLPNIFLSKRPWDLWDGSDRPAVGNWGLPKLFPLGQLCFHHVVSGNEQCWGESTHVCEIMGQHWKNPSRNGAVWLGQLSLCGGESQGWVWGPLFCISCSTPPTFLIWNWTGEKKMGGIATPLVKSCHNNSCCLKILSLKPCFNKIPSRESNSAQ